MRVQESAFEVPRREDGRDSPETLKKLDLLVTLPVYNEKPRLRPAVERLLSVLPNLGANYRIALVEDGSSDGSDIVARELADEHGDVYFLHSDLRLGRGEAIRRCWKNVEAEVYVFMDTDLSADLSALSLLVKKVRDGHDVVTGSRYAPGARVSRPPLRMLISLVYNWLVNEMFGDGVKDYQCGFKAFSNRAVRDLLPQTTEPTWFWDTEVLVLARVFGYAVEEVPVDWKEMKVSRTPIRRLASDILLHAGGLLRLQQEVKNANRRISASPHDQPGQNQYCGTTSPSANVAQGTTPHQDIILVNNYNRTGIGDFGHDLLAHLGGQGLHLKLVPTPTSWMDFPKYCFSTLTFDGNAIFNVGLTSWGRSPARNFLGFALIRLRKATGHKDLVLLHNVIETIDSEKSGYKVSSLTAKGAHVAVKQLSRVPVVVFSKRMDQLLRDRYQISPVLSHPLPIDVHPEAKSLRGRIPTVLMIGYLAPYKGYDLLLDALKTRDIQANVIIAGDAHRMLKEDPGYLKFLDTVEQEARALHAQRLPRVHERDLPSLMSKVDLGILPYSACQGGSAVASLFISYRIPILATDLPEFKELAEMGGGVVLSPYDPKEFSRRMKDLLENPVFLDGLRDKQEAFGRMFNWGNFVERLLEYIH